MGRAGARPYVKKGKMQNGRRITQNYGGSPVPPPNDSEEGYKPKRFEIKERISEMLGYAMPIVDTFPRRNRKLADEMRNSMLEMMRLAIRLEKRIHKKTTIDDLDVELSVLKEFVVLASETKYNGAGFAPPLTIHQRETWSRYTTEIGKMIGGYKNYLRDLDNGSKEK